MIIHVCDIVIGAVTSPQPAVPEVDLEVDVGPPLTWLPLDVYQNLTSAGLITSELFPAFFFLYWSVCVRLCVCLTLRLSVCAPFSFGKCRP